MVIGPKTLKTAIDMISAMIDANGKKIDQAYCGQEEEALTVTMSIKFSPGPHGIQIDTSIGFIESRVKEKAMVVVDEKQIDLFFPGTGIEKIEVIKGHE